MQRATVFCHSCGSPSAEDAHFCQTCGATVSVRAADVATVQPSAHPILYGGFWIRVVASILDTLLLFAAVFPLRMLLGSVVTAIGFNAEIPTREVLVLRRVVRIAIGILLALAYRAGMESSVFQATLGKMVVGLKVTDLEGRRLSFARAAARYFSKYLSTLCLGLGYVMVAFDEQKRALHDRIAGTRVQYRESRTLTTGGNVHPAAPVPR